MAATSKIVAQTLADWLSRCSLLWHWLTVEIVLVLLIGFLWQLPLILDFILTGSSSNSIFSAILPAEGLSDTILGPRTHLHQFQLRTPGWIHKLTLFTSGGGKYQHNPASYIYTSLDIMYPKSTPNTPAPCELWSFTLQSLNEQNARRSLPTMPIRRGRFAPQNTFLETIAEKFDRGSKYDMWHGSSYSHHFYPASGLDGIICWIRWHNTSTISAALTRLQKTIELLLAILSWAIYLLAHSSRSLSVLRYRY